MKLAWGAHRGCKWKRASLPFPTPPGEGTGVGEGEGQEKNREGGEGWGRGQREMDHSNPLASASGSVRGHQTFSSRSTGSCVGQSLGQDAIRTSKGDPSVARPGGAVSLWLCEGDYLSSRRRGRAEEALPKNGSFPINSKGQCDFF